MAVTLHTSLGDLKLELFCSTAPRTTFNFLALAASNSYTSTTFHRNIPGFMIQGGDPTGTGKGGDSIWGGTFDDEFHPENLHHGRGVVSMANKGPGSNRAQFFITYGKQEHLDGVYTVFGQVLSGFEVLDQMERLPSMADKEEEEAASELEVQGEGEGEPKKKKKKKKKKKGLAHRPVDPPVIRGVTIHANPFAEEGVVYPTKDGPPERVQ